MKIIATNEEYGSLICQFIEQHFPHSLKISTENLLEILTIVLIGSKDLRYGPIPKIENQYLVRQVISHSIKEHMPIHLLVPWGGRKAFAGSEIDIAEVMAIKQLIDLNELVKKYYSPGLSINIRIEDTGAVWLYKDPKGVETYSNAFDQLVNILKESEGLINTLHPIRESTLMNQDEYNSLSMQLSSHIHFAMRTGDNSRLESIGWKGGIPENQKNFYLDRYKLMYPHQTPEENLKTAADYFGGSLARYKLNGRAEPVTVPFINATFVSPIPGAPAEMTGRTLYYRTLPEKYARTHAAAWRAKGYLQVLGNNVVPKLVHKDTPELIENYIVFSNDSREVRVRADYHVVDSFAFPSGLMI